MVAAGDGNCGGMTIYHPAGEKRPTASQQAPLLSSSLQQRGDKKCKAYCGTTPSQRGLFAHNLNAASRCKLTTDATVCSGAESTKLDNCQ
ncbi:hypothetical protein TNCV_1151231 [Trichonephila clavipes]|nr:hypothetical protein TNCV_1151231 [Trichonephila clavipes]